MRGAAARRARGRVVALALVLVLALVLGGPGLCAASAGGRTASPPAQPDDAEIDRFAAACVATEPLRKARDREIWKRSNPVSYLWLRATRGKQVAKWMSSPLMNQECREAYVDYISQTGRIIDSCNLTVCRFNDLSRYVRADKNVRHKTMRRIRLLKELEREEDELKSELLRELSVLEDATAATTTEEETEPKDLAAQESDGGMWELLRPAEEEPPAVPSRVELFAKAAKMVNRLQEQESYKLLESRTDIVKAARDMGRTMDEAKLHYLHHRELAHEEFVNQAEKLVHDIGLSNEEFNDLARRARKNPIFRLRVELEMRKR